MQKKIPPDAFDFYFSLGPSRSYQAVADRYSVSKRAITNAARREGWQNRLFELEAKAREKSDEKTVDTLASMRERHLKAIHVIQGKALAALKTMPIQSAMDAVRALGLSLKEERIVVGEPGERTAVSVENVIRKEYERWLVPEPSIRNGNSAVRFEDNDDQD